MNTKHTIWVMSSLLGALIATAGAQQDEGIKLGGMTLHPFAAGEVNYDDNVFQEADGREDTYYELAVGAKLKRETDTFKFDSSLWWAQRFYDEFGAEKDGNRWGIAGMLRNDSDKTFGAMMVHARQVDDYDQAPAFGRVPSGFEGTVDAAFDRTAGNEKRRIVDFGAGGGHDLSDVLNIMGGYKFYAVDYYDDPALLNWYEHKLGTELSLLATDKMAVYVDGQLGVQNGDGAPGGEQAQLFTARVGVKNDLTDKSTLRLGLGATYYKTDFKSYTAPSFDLAGLWAASEKVNLFINGSNDVQPVGDAGNSKTSARTSAGVNYTMNEVVSAVLSGSFIYDKYLGNVAGSKPESKTAIGTFRLNVTPVKRLNLFAQIEFTDARQDIGADYDRMRGSLGAGYQF